MAHRQLLRRAVLAVGLASAVGAFAQGAPVPPGAEAPGYGGDEIETIIVVGDKLRCPDGTRVATINECPGFIQSWLERVYRLPWDPVTHVINMASIPNAPTCGATVDASCACGTGKVKVYDEDADEFHCYDEPPPGCPKWDDMFDFDLSVWACTARPLDATAQAAVDRIKGCFSTASTIHKFWNNVQRFEYGTACPPGKPACVISCSSGGASNVVQFNKAELNTVRLDNEGNPIDATAWQWFAEALNHELRHVRHNAKYGCGPWNNGNFWTGEQVASFLPRNRIGEERWTGYKAVVEYGSELGVKSPYDQGYKPANDKQLPNCRLW